MDKTTNSLPSPERHWWVDVAVPVPLRQTFTYKVPEEVDPKSIRIGHRVLVPFRSRLLYGITTTIAYTPKQNHPKMRPFVSYEAHQRLLAPEIHKLLNWVTRYYRVPIGEAMKLAMPPGMLSERESQFKLSSKGEQEDFSTAEGRVLSAIAGKPLTKKVWETKTQTKIAFQSIRHWEEQGLIEITAEGQTRESIPHEWAVRLTTVGAAIEAEVLKGAPKQKQALDFIRKHHQEWVPTSDVNDAFSGASNLIKQLEKRNFCERRRIPKHELALQRQPWDPEPVKVLTEEQDTALKAIIQSLETKSFNPFLLFGVTGSGKTEVYLRAIHHCLSQGKQALFLVPEIALTPMMQRRIVSRFGEDLAILHSAIGAGRRAENWARVLAGKVSVVLGARSGIFAPLPNLGLVIVDEEHDHSYKQNDGVRYQARDLALVRAQMADATVVLGSATPSMESWNNVERQRSQLLTMKHRATKATLPQVEIIDMREVFKAQKRRPLFSEALLDQMKRVLAAGQQVMILLNRRGYHSFLMCRKCGETVTCSQCEVSLTYHQNGRVLKCHYCESSRPVPVRCDECGSPAALMQFFGEGTQKIQEYLQKYFPDAVVDRLDRDRLSRKNASRDILAAFEKKKTHVLVGTQMIAKGHDFPNVTLVGIINADIGLRMPDFRSAEMTFQLLTQVSGRSGRGKEAGKVIIQTYMPEHYSITCAAKHDFPAFLEREMRYRQHLFYAPSAHMASLFVTHESDQKARETVEWIAARINASRDPDLVLLGPAKAPIGKIKNAHRYQIIGKSRQRTHLHRRMDEAVEVAVTQKRIHRQAIILDIDPYQFF